MSNCELILLSASHEPEHRQLATLLLDLFRAANVDLDSACSGCASVVVKEPGERCMECLVAEAEARAGV